MYGAFISCVVKTNRGCPCQKESGNVSHIPDFLEQYFGLEVIMVFQETECELCFIFAWEDRISDRISWWFQASVFFFFFLNNKLRQDLRCNCLQSRFILLLQRCWKMHTQPILCHWFWGMPRSGPNKVSVLGNWN